MNKARNTKGIQTSTGVPNTTESPSPGVIQPGCLMTVEEAKRRLQVKAWAWRQMKRAGLRTVRVGSREYVITDDLIAFFRRKLVPED